MYVDMSGPRPVQEDGEGDKPNNMHETSMSLDQHAAPK